MKKNILRRYDSVSALVDQAESRPTTIDTCNLYTSRKNLKRDEWNLSQVDASDYAGDMTLEEALRVARYGGWEAEYSDEVRGIFDDLVPRMRDALSFDFERRVDVAGDQVDMDAFVQGMPEHMMNWFPIEQETRRGVVTLLLGVAMRGCTICSYAGCSAAPAVTARDAFIRGQAIVGLIRTLKLLGMELEIWTEMTVANSLDYSYSMLTRVQHAGDITDESSLEFACGHPGWSRRVHFRAMENETDRVRQQFRFGVDDGRPGSYSQVRPPQHKATVGADIVLDLGTDWLSTYSSGSTGTGRALDVGEDWMGATSDVTPEMVTRWVVDQLVKCNVLTVEKAEKVLEGIV